jgi:poly(A) polymerase
MGEMRSQVGEAVRVEQAVSVLEWAVAVATEDPGLLVTPPPRPTPAELREVPVETLREHLDRLLVARHAEPGLDALHAGGVLDVWLPEVAGLVGFGDGEWRHKDVWKHTKQVVRQAVPKLAVRWGALLHDIAKPRTRSIEPSGEVHFFGHAEVGAAMFRKRVAQRLALEGELYERIHFLILYHLRASQYDGSWTDSAVRRFAREMGDGLDDLLALSRADITTKRPHRRQRGLRQISDLAARIREIEEQDARVAPLPKGLGHAIMEAFGIPPSKRLGELRDELEALCLRGELDPGQAAEYYVAYLREHADELGLR